MKKDTFEQYSDKHLHFYDLKVPPLLAQAITLKKEKAQIE